MVSHQEATFMTIAEISKTFGLSQDTLRYYERIGLIPCVNRNKSGMREYNDEDSRWIEFIKCMRSAGLPIETLIEYVRFFRKATRLSKPKALLIEQRKLLLEKMEDLRGR